MKTLYATRIGKLLSQSWLTLARNKHFSTKLSKSEEDPYLRHLFELSPTFNAYDTHDVINLAVGAPGPDLLQHCGDMLEKATLHRLREERKEGKYYLFQYGISAGLWECRDELAKFLTRRYGSHVARENLILTCGATSGLQLILNSIISPNGVVFVDEVTYMLALDVFKQFPMKRIVTVPMRNGVVDLDAMEEIIHIEKKFNYMLGKDKIFWAMYYAIPTYHNPTGMTLDTESCKRLVQLARQNSFVIVCDDVYNLLHYNHFPPQRLFYHDNVEDTDYKGGNVISNGSFSKILSPAIRLGWLECSPNIASILKNSGILKSSGAVNHYVSGLIASLLRLRLEDNYLNFLIKTYGKRMKTMCDTLDEYLPNCCSFNRPNGGYFVWIKLPEAIEANLFIEWCQELYKVTALPGSDFSNQGNSKNFIRVSIAFHEHETLKSAGKSLCKSLVSYIHNKESVSNLCKI